MGKKILYLLEKYVDKMVLGIIGIICLALLWFFVFSGPYSVSYMNKKHSPGDIDKKVLTQAKKLEEKMNESPVHPPSIQSKSDLYTEKLASASDIIDENVFIQLPGFGQVATIDDRSYAKPDIPDLTDVEVGWYRTVVHMPLEDVDSTHRYDTVSTDYKDIDLITVQGTFDYSKLLRNFQNSFNSPLFKADYRSPELATPLFADVQLERQQLTESGWSEWEVVNRSKVDPFKGLISEIPEKMTREYIGGISILMSNYNGPDIQAGIIQPGVYEFASSTDMWLPPSFHFEYKKIFDDQWNQTRDKLEIARRANRNAGNGNMENFGRKRDDKRRISRNDPRKVERTLKDVISDASDVIVDREKGILPTSDSIVIWANDDTVEANKTYRYRMRVGVFNPTAGKGWLDNKEYANNVVLWGEYTDITDSVEIEPMTYLFPLDMNKDETAVTIKLAKFYMGKWRTSDFDVKKGQLLGGEVEIVPEDNTSNRSDIEMPSFGESFSYNEEPIIVDFSTDILLVDVVGMTDLLGSNMLRQRNYNDVLYTSGDGTISRMPTKKTNWPDEVQDKFDDVRVSEEVPVQVTTRGSGNGLDGLMPNGGMNMFGGEF